MKPNVVISLTLGVLGLTAVPAWSAPLTLRTGSDRAPTLHLAQHHGSQCRTHCYHDHHGHHRCEVVCDHHGRRSLGN